ncbi:hypothetical protein M758_10G178500 [Ceratodon purpureus]|nr:hypothetical protein M758_10G178500 [Ceratodon purpureus]
MLHITYIAAEYVASLATPSPTYANLCQLMPTYATANVPMQAHYKRMQGFAAASSTPPPLLLLLQHRIASSPLSPLRCGLAPARVGLPLPLPSPLGIASLMMPFMSIFIFMFKCIS